MKNKKLKYLILPVIIAGYFAAMFSADLFLHKRAKKLENAGELESLVQAERKKLKAENKEIIINISEGSSALSAKLDEGVYFINLGIKSCNSYAVKHEVYHIAKGHCDEIKGGNKILNEFKYYFWLEPAVIRYYLLE